MTDEISLPGDPQSPKAAREFVVARLVEWGVDRATQETARLLTSELATNAVLHSRGPFGVAVGWRGDARVRVSVHDEGAALPRVRADDALADVGLDLRIVSQLAAQWGFASVPDDGKDVWFEVATTAGSADRSD